MSASVSFYTRPLPSSVCSFTSPKSQVLLGLALEQGTANIYFPLAQQYMTQNEPAYCGIATLCMILNASAIDPLQTWKGVWRWFDQEMLNCCRSLSSMQQQGITIAEFVCLARCNSLKAESRLELSLKSFREDVIKICSGRSEYLAVSYSRQVLSQTGTGHFSPIAAYAKDKDDVEWILVLDVARFKYPAYWVSLEMLFAAIDTVDDTSGAKRGYAILSKTDVGAEVSTDATSLLQIKLNKLSVRYLLQHASTSLETASSWTIPPQLVDIVTFLDPELAALEFRTSLRERRARVSIACSELLVNAVNEHLAKQPLSCEATEEVRCVNQIRGVIEELERCCSKESQDRKASACCE